MKIAYGLTCVALMIMILSKSYDKYGDDCRLLKFRLLTVIK